MEDIFYIRYWLVESPRLKLIAGLVIFTLLSGFYALRVFPYDSVLATYGIPRLFRMLLLLLPFCAALLTLIWYLAKVIYQCEQLVITKDSLAFVRRGYKMIFRKDDITQFIISEQMATGMITSYLFNAKGTTYSIYTAGTAIRHDFVHQALEQFFELEKYQPVVEEMKGVEKRVYVLR
ncbi:hypothetical protein [Chitinophaga qingshengii]|uniref:PH domain-containing protein n=1 Tax=Chitinophaga qingshengii TaxID=1569794 RepID=A0ABR7TJF7_9BACT|nr:hypothetical protein [Chitinophaga qingshengii]MBC9930621.1 hypothetical protein [Chitinophaga qingshengii]